MRIDTDEESSPAQQSMAWAWLGSYAGMISVIFAGIFLHERFGMGEPGPRWFCSVPVTVAFLVLYRGCVARHWSRWLRVPGLLALACGLSLWMVSFFACAFLAIALSMRGS